MASPVMRAAARSPRGRQLPDHTKLGHLPGLACEAEHNSRNCSARTAAYGTKKTLVRAIIRSKELL